jgi:hypothetical protein
MLRFARAIVLLILLRINPGFEPHLEPSQWAIPTPTP